jgi:hypothetical protein
MRSNEVKQDNPVHKNSMGKNREGTARPRRPSVKMMVKKWEISDPVSPAKDPGQLAVLDSESFFFFSRQVQIAGLCHCA